MSGGKRDQHIEVSKGKWKGKGTAVDDSIEQEDDVMVDAPRHIPDYLFDPWSDEAGASSIVDAPLQYSSSYPQHPRQIKDQESMQQTQTNEDDSEEILRLMMSHEEAMQSVSAAAVDGAYAQVEGGAAPFPYHQGDISESDAVQPQSSTEVLLFPVENPDNVNIDSFIFPWLTSTGQSHQDSTARSQIVESPLLFGSPSYSSGPSISPVMSISPSYSFHTASLGSTSSLPISPVMSTQAPISRHMSASSESETSNPACDVCRKRKVKCDRQRPVCGYCARLKLPCTTNDELRRRGPTPKLRRDALREAGLVYDRGKRQWRAIVESESVSVDETRQQESPEAVTQQEGVSTTSASSKSSSSRAESRKSK